MATSSPLVARSTDGSLVAIHPQNITSASKTGLVRCYDGNISNGSLKFTLRFPLSSSSQDYDDGVPTAALEKKDGLHKLLFASTSYLCGMKQSSSSILIWDLHRGVLASTIDIHDSATDKKKKKKKQRKSSLVATGNEILCDVATEGNQLFALIYFPHNNNDNESGGKCRLYQYNLSSEGSTLVRKIKVGSYNGGTEPQQQQPVFGIGISESTIVVRLGNNHVRIIDIVSGDKLCKIDIPSDGQQSGGGEVVESVESTIFAPLSITRDGSYIVTSINGNQAVVLSYAKGNDDDDDKNTKHSLQTLAILSSNKADDSLITSLDITQDKGKDELSVVAFQSTVGISSLFNISTTSTSTTSMVPQLPQATLQTNENDKLLSFIGSSFSSRTPNESLLLLFTQAKHAGGSAAGSGGTNLPMELFSYGSSLEGKVIVGTSLSAAESGDGSKDKKRKAVTTALAPGDQGQESSLASDLMMGAGKKKARVSFGGVEAEEGEEGEKEVAGGEKGDDFLDMDMSDDDEDGEQAQSIAERLALLSSAMEETDDEDDEDDDDEDDDEDGKDSKPKKKQFQLKSATSETLTTLLTQALSSNDSSQLNIALQVTDRRLVDGTIRALQSLDAERAASQASADEDGDTKVAATGSVGYIPTLMAHIVRRMARRHSLVMTLGIWVKAILAATARSSSHQLLNEEMNVVEEQMAKDGKDMARKLGPLKNFLNERVECFPQLLRLEGRLSLLNQQL